MKNVLTYLVLLVFVQNSFAQNITLTGHVLKNSTKTPVMYANVSIKGYPVGVSTNEIGEFSFHIPHNYYNDTLLVSAIGYSTYECAIGELNNNDSLIIQLEEQIYELENVVVFPEDQLKGIIRNVTKNLKKNCPNHRYMLNGFYRELVLKDNSYTRLIEAAVDVQKPGFNSESGDLVRVNELRKSNSYIDYDWKSILMGKIVGEENYLLGILGKDIVTNKKRSYSTKEVFKNDFIKNYDFVLENVSMIDSVRIFEIRFCHKKYYEEGRSDFSVMLNHWISVRENNFAVLKYVSKLQIVKEFDKSEIVNFEDNCIDKHTVYYKEYEEKYYPYLFESTNLIIAKHANEETGEGKQYMKSTLLINNILTKRSKYEKVKQKISSPKDLDLYNQEYKYHPEFWEHYNILQINPIFKQVKEDLEDEKTLEEQFIENGK
ncbi:MAG: carboxypeptidase-like regulatory domain-containing protein [Bacteroidales bacterium]|nr:carboxypeptidase-like regulatory domain-containing protein [Bacteroidales bacterium]